jgi:hypothetical protein
VGQNGKGYASQRANESQHIKKESKESVCQELQFDVTGT